MNYQSDQNQYFNIGWTDLSFEAQEEIKGQLLEMIKDDPERMGEITDEAIEEYKGLWEGKKAPYDENAAIDMKLEEIVDEEAPKRFVGKGSI